MHFLIFRLDEETASEVCSFILVVRNLCHSLLVLFCFVVQFSHNDTEPDLPVPNLTEIVTLRSDFSSTLSVTPLTKTAQSG